MVRVSWSRRLFFNSSVIANEVKQSRATCDELNKLCDFCKESGTFSKCRKNFIIEDPFPGLRRFARNDDGGETLLSATCNDNSEKNHAVIFFKTFNVY